MSEENVQETTETAETEVVETEATEENKPTALDAMTPEELKAHIKELRKENASHRTAKQAKAKELEEFQKWKDSQKSELDRTKEEAESLRKENYSLLKTSIALGAGLSLDDVEFINGETPDDMKASAEKLASRLKTDGGKPSTTTNVFAGTRGAPINEGPKDTKQLANETMAQLIWGNR